MLLCFYILLYYTYYTSRDVNIFIFLFIHLLLCHARKSIIRDILNISTIKYSVLVFPDPPGQATKNREPPLKQRIRNFTMWMPKLSSVYLILLRFFLLLVCIRDCFLLQISVIFPARISNIIRSRFGNMLP